MSTKAVCLIAVMLLTVGVYAAPTEYSAHFGFGFPAGQFAEFTEAGVFAGGLIAPWATASLIPAIRLDGHYFPSDYEIFDRHNPAAFLLQFQSDIPLGETPIYLLGSGGGGLIFSATPANNWRGGLAAGVGAGIDFEISKRDVFLEGRYVHVWMEGADGWDMIPVSFGLRF